MNHTKIILIVVACLLVVGLYSEVTGMMVGRANAPIRLTADDLEEGYRVGRTIVYIIFSNSVEEVKFSEMEYPEHLGYVENLEEPGIRYVGKDGKFKHLAGIEIKNAEWKSMEELTIKPNVVYKLYVNRGGEYLRYPPKTEE